jgi:hypothetical protein
MSSTSGLSSSKDLNGLTLRTKKPRPFKTLGTTHPVTPISHPRRFKPSATLLQETQIFTPSKF